MAEFFKGNMWQVYNSVDLFLFTGNAALNGEGELVMGRGLAWEVKTKFPFLPKVFGEMIGINNSMLTYGLLIPKHHVQARASRIGVFQVKNHWKQDAKLSLIQSSVNHLINYLAMFPGMTSIALNFPGIGNGRLKREDVLPIVQRLPDCVQVWEK